MNENQYLNPTSVKAMSTSAQARLRDDNAVLDIAYKALEEFINDNTNKGAAVKAKQEYLNNYLNVITLMKGCNDGDILDWQKVSQGVGDEVLDGSVIIPQINRARSSKESHANSAGSYRSLAASADDLLLKAAYYSTAAYHDSMAWYEGCVQDRWQRKSDRYDYIERTTSGYLTDKIGPRFGIVQAMNDQQFDPISGKDFKESCGVKEEKIKFGKETGKFISKMVGATGVSGTIASNWIDLGMALSSGESYGVAKSAVGLVKGNVGRIEKLIKCDGNNLKQTLLWDNTVGGAAAKLYKTADNTFEQALAAAKAASKGDIFCRSLKSQINGYRFTQAKGLTSKMAVGAKWAGTALAFVAAGIDNKKEYDEKLGTADEITKERAVAETFIEGAGGVVLGMLATAAVTAAIGTTVPAVVVGVAAVGAVWAVDKVTHLVTKNVFSETSDYHDIGATEVVANFACDTAEAIAKWGSSLIDNMFISSSPTPAVVR